MTELRTNVMVRGEARFDMVGQKLPYSLHDTDEQISPGLVTRLYRYALRELVESGFEISSWDCEVYTMDGNLRPSERYYCVEFTGPKGGMIGVQGIMTNYGWPCLDHGLCVGRDRS
ncbi:MULTISPECIES: hypothetical protein [unclassified Mesorhizobium]|uniref:hypothetical protein n=1 Tax=unclassified Mesorhizobium TaxID=325217 RepID=UPI001126CD27|nr:MULTISPECIES: hypothetical protein [unclassified Mesorhizobium]TPJ51760.1 hypothetical protein FJ426_18820 [Mesorhizobium sp. B2-6-4]TPN42382.1 hypothetical protein FJ979_02235 [Mesorhizobium sp. B1-1-6]